MSEGFPGGSDKKESTCNAGDLGSIPGLERPPGEGNGFDPCVGTIPWRRERPPTPVFWPRELHGERCPAGDSPRDRKESDTTERLFPLCVKVTVPSTDSSLFHPLNCGPSTTVPLKRRKNPNSEKLAVICKLPPLRIGTGGI